VGKDEKFFSGWFARVHNYVKPTLRLSLSIFDLTPDTESE